MKGKRLKERVGQLICIIDKVILTFPSLLASLLNYLTGDFFSSRVFISSGALYILFYIILLAYVVKFPLF